MSKVIVISGLPGSGKSTIAERLAQKLNVPIFSVDPIESAILKSGIKRSFETGLAAYLVAEDLAAEQLKLGSSAIIDAVNPVKEARDMWQILSKKYDVPLVLIECVLDPELHRNRIEKRTRNMHGIQEVTWEDVEKRKKEYMPWTEERLVLDTAIPIEELVGRAVEYINSSL
jgi:predicted kinase